MQSKISYRILRKAMTQKQEKQLTEIIRPMVKKALYEDGSYGLFDKNTNLGLRDNVLRQLNRSIKFGHKPDDEELQAIVNIIKKYVPNNQKFTDFDEFINFGLNLK